MVVESQAREGLATHSTELTAGALGWRTERERKSELDGHPCPFEEIVPIHLLTLTLATTFAVHAPIVLVASLCSFAVSFLVNKNMCKFVYVPSSDTGGGLWNSIFGNVVAGLIISQLTLIGIFGLKQANIHQMTIMIALLVLTCIFWWTEKSRFDKLAKYLPLQEAMDADAELATGMYKRTTGVSVDVGPNGVEEKSSSTIKCEPFQRNELPLARLRTQLEVYTQPSLRRSQIRAFEADAYGH